MFCVRSAQNRAFFYFPQTFACCFFQKCVLFAFLLSKISSNSPKIGIVHIFVYSLHKMDVILLYDITNKEFCIHAFYKKA